MYYGSSPYTPSPEQIKEACAEIRQSWSETTRESRHVYKPKNYIELEPVGTAHGRRDPTEKGD